MYHLKLVLFTRCFLALFIAALLRVKEAPAAVLEEALRVVGDGLHNLGPVERLHALRVPNVTGAVPGQTGEGDDGLTKG